MGGGVREDGVLRVSSSGGPGSAVDITAPLGPNLAVDSVSFTLATDEDPIPVTIPEFDVTLSSRLNTLGQKAMAASAPVVIASDQSAIPVTPVPITQVSNTGLIDAVGETVVLEIQGRPYVGITLNNGLTADMFLIVEFSTDGGVTWDERLFYNGDNWVGAEILPHLEDDIRTWSVSVTPSDTHVRVRCITYISGSTTVTIKANQIVDVPVLASNLYNVIHHSPEIFDAIDDSIETMVFNQSIGFTIRVGTFAGTLVVETSPDSYGNDTWISSLFFFGDSWKLSLVLTNPNSSGNISVPLTGGIQRVRVKVSAYTSGSLEILVKSGIGFDAFALALADGINGASFPFLSRAIAGLDGATHRALAATSTGALKTDSKTDLTPSAPAVSVVGVASAEHVAAAATRKGLFLRNLSQARISLGFGSPAVLDSGITLYPRDSYQMNEYDFDLGAVNAIASAAASNMAIQQYLA